MKLQVVDGERFQRLLQQLLEDHDSQEAAAKELGLSQSMFSRFAGGAAYSRDSITVALWHRIKNALLHHRHWSKERRWAAVRELERAVLSPDASDIYWRRYIEDWLIRTALRPFGEVTKDGALVFTAGSRDAKCKRLIDELRRRYPDEFTPLDRLLAANRVASPRHTLALMRIADPLLAHEESGGVERGLEEMKKAGDLGPYLKAAVRRELILLKRDSDMKRAQESAAETPSQKKRK